MDRNKIPQKFYDEFKAAAAQIKVPADIMLPVEAMDGSIGHSTIVAVLVLRALGEWRQIQQRERANGREL